MAIITHFGCEPWLAGAVEGLLAMGRPPDAIVVADDASSEPPRMLLREFPNVTLVRSDENTGPYSLIQRVIDASNYDAYLFQDADDWSLPGRLETLLNRAGRAQAELVGCFELRLTLQTGGLQVIRFPEDVNAAFASQPGGNFLCLPSSVISRNLVMRLGGFSTGLRFGGDSEFLQRAHYRARIINVPAPLYLRRKRPGSLTTSPETGHGSVVRKRLARDLGARAVANARAVKRGEEPDLRPFALGKPVGLLHLSGPPLA